jgi:hypothetical protein
MKKQIIILLIFFFNSLFICAQNFIKTNSPCNDEILKNVRGEWIHWGDPWYAKISKQHELEIRKRVETIHQFVFTLTPTLPGMDVAWGIHSADYDFAQQAKTEHFQDGHSRVNFFNGIPLVQYTYGVGFFEYSCGKYGDNNFMRKGHPREDGASLSVAVNTLNKFLLRDYGGTEAMQIDGRNIKMMPNEIGTWKGYTMYDTDYSDFSILLHRDGMLPYIPVTRKQYLELAISYFNKFYDNSIKGYDDPAIAAFIDKKQKEENIKIQQKLRNDVLKYYQDELAATTKVGLLDSPAIVLGFLNSLTNYPIFTTDAKAGNMLVTENPKYFQKDLPKHIPQLFIFSMSKMRWWFTPKIDPITVLEENFPIEKLQAMIDK